jgi:hypothetical protein
MMSTDLSKISDLVNSGKVSGDEGKALLKKLHQMIDDLENATMISSLPTDIVTPMHHSPYVSADEEDDEFVDCNGHHSKAMEDKDNRRIRSIHVSSARSTPPQRTSPVVVLERPAHVMDLQRDAEQYRKTYREDSSTDKLDVLSTEIQRINLTLQEHSSILKFISGQLLPQSLHAQAQDSVITDSSSSIFETIPPLALDPNLLSTQNPHPLDGKITLGIDTGNFKVDVELESIAVVLKSYCKQFNANEAILSMRKSPTWGPANKYFKMSDDEIKAAWYVLCVCVS